MTSSAEVWRLSLFLGGCMLLGRGIEPLTFFSGSTYLELAWVCQGQAYKLI
jgi:hypothetical protein